jgi:hypothetical protein
MTRDPEIVWVTEPEDLLGELLDVLNADPATRDLPNVPELAAAVLPLLRDVVATELSMAADAAEYCVENPEMPWAQGVQFVAEALRDRSHAIEAQKDGDGGAE